MGDDSEKMILLTGATGYVGGRLLRALESRGLPVRCLVRRLEVLQNRVASSTELYKGDVLDYDSLKVALKNIHTAYYLIHNLGESRDFEKIEEQGAINFAAAAKANNVQRIIYLGGLCDESEKSLSPHLRSRFHVGDMLRESGVQTLEFRASVIIGSGSLSFELIRALVLKLPVMITPKWVSVMAQPIGVKDVIEYLMEALNVSMDRHNTYEIGGAEQMSYGGLIKEYARIRGLKRLLISVPVLTPRLSSLWLHIVTPIYSQVGRKLIDSMKVPSIVRDNSALAAFPIVPLSVPESIKQASNKEDSDYAETHWADALSSSSATKNWGGTKFGNRIVDSKSIQVSVKPELAFIPIQQIGGARGYYYANWLWRFRGLIDRLLGGVGMQRGRRDIESLRVGDVIDCWRVESIEIPNQLTLAAEMRIPGRAWLKYEVEPDSGSTKITQTAIYDPVGLMGIIYWYSAYLVHKLVFSGMLKEIGKAAEVLNEKIIADNKASANDNKGDGQNDKTKG